ncbi:MAG TPA: ribbon-helix-helix domain-containing protein [Propionibacteriaceae bacterium]|nr:ribbon-helix-helix domain-containing protein [Propionibacteriaceae bacterium]
MKRALPTKMTRSGRVRVTINLPPDLVKAAKIAAIQRDMDFQDLVAEALQAVIKTAR